MIVDPQELTAVLAGTSLEGLPVGHGPRGTLIIADVPDDGYEEAWQQARDLMPVTGRWPVLVETADDEFEMHAERDPEAPTEGELREFARVARSADPWPDFMQYDDPEEAEEEQKRYDAVREDADAAAAALDVWMNSDYSSLEPLKLVLLPTTFPWMAPNWIYYLGADEHDESAVGAAFWQWHERYDARLRFCWFGLQLTFEVGCPPAPGAQAWELSGQIHALTGDPKTARWETALALPRARTWKIFDRP